MGVCSWYARPISTFDAFLATLDAGTLDSLVGADTIVPSEVDTGERQAIALVQALAPGASVQLRFGDVIGEGGMGVVHAAEQISLGRTVAVKTLKAGHTGAVAVRNLLREAWITGAVEHPSVVPVHYLELDRNGVPLVVLKKIEGTVWSKLIGSPAEVTRRFGATDQLAWNLGILVQLLHAVRFAHSRGILHRDLKPSNVMIGDFGEVYLIDWGIAVSLRDDSSGRLPLANRSKKLAGTPGYMAPEMLGRDTDVLDERTDVYLAGAVLFEIVTGHPPHVGRDPLSIITHILTAEPQLPSSAPVELQRICSRALSVEAAERFESIEAMRLALQGYLEHRGSSALCARATADLARLRERVASSQREEIYRLFGACRFGFHEALSVWRENDDARAGLADATVTLAEFELAHDNPNAAVALLGEIDAPPEVLARAREAAETHARRKAELEQLHRDLDLTIHRRGRLYVGVLIGLVFTAMPVLDAHADIGYRGHLQHVSFSFSVAVLLAGVMWWTRHTIGSTAINRRTLISVSALFLAQSALGAGTWALGIPLETVKILHIVVWASVLSMLAIHVDWRLAPSAIGYFAAFLVSARWSSLRPYVASGSNLVMTINLMWIWRAPRR